MPGRRSHHSRRRQGRHRQDLRAGGRTRSVAGIGPSGSRRGRRTPRGEAAAADAGIATTSVAALLAISTARTGPAATRRARRRRGGHGRDATARGAARRVERSDGKLVLVGDHRQAAGARGRRHLPRTGSARTGVELTENRRQREAWERRALDLLREGGRASGPSSTSNASASTSPRPPERRARCSSRLARDGERVTP